MESVAGIAERRDRIVIGRRSRPLTGTITVPGDKSITHRALFFGALHAGRTEIVNPSPALDPRSTLELIRSLGYHVVEHHGTWGLDGTRRSSHAGRLVLDCGNSGTTARLAAGFLTGEKGQFVLTGDESLSRRPMERIVRPLRRLGFDITSINGSLPVTVIAHQGKSIEEEEINDHGGEAGGGVIDVASAQVHTALVLAAARSSEGILLRRTKPMRDHTLRIARLFGIAIEQRGDAEFVHPIDRVLLSDREHTVTIDVPGDVSSAAFMVAAALIVPGSDLTIENVGLNPTRIAFLETVRAMGGRVEWNVTDDSYEPHGTIHIRHSPDLHGIVVDDEGAFPVALMMDELPLLALLGALAQGETIVRGAGELRVKESDRIAATVSLLGAIGIVAEELPDGFRVAGGQSVAGGAEVNHHGDHRLAMLAGVAGTVAESSVTIRGPGVADVSWPGVWEVLGVH